MMAKSLNILYFRFIALPKVNALLIIITILCCKDEEFARLQYKKHVSVLQKLESGEHDRLHAERVRDAIEELQTRILSLEEAVSLACFSISNLRDEELYPQIIELSAG